MKMLFHFWIFSFLVLSLRVVDCVLVTENNTIELYELDLHNQAKYPWSVSSEKHSGFFYFDNLTSDNFIRFADEYLRDVDMSNLKSAQGIWASFYTKVLILQEYFPYITFASDVVSAGTVEITYGIYGQGRMLIKGTGIEEVLKSDGANLTWKMFTVNFTGNHFKMSVIPDDEGDFILIDRVIIKAQPHTCTVTNEKDTGELSFPSTATAVSIEAKSIEFILDFRNESGSPWDLSTLNYEDWFFYYDNLTAESLTEFAENYFMNVTLSNIELAQGVWASFYSKPPPIFGEEFPSVKFGLTAQSWETMELTYYIHGHAFIRIREDGFDDRFHLIGRNYSNNFPNWETYSLNLESSFGLSFQIYLIPEEENAFILIDKIVLRKADTTTPTTNTIRFNTTTVMISTTTAVSEPDKEYILDTSEQAESSPWTVSELLPNQFDYFEDLEYQSISEFAEVYFESHSVQLDHLQLPTVHGIWTAFYSSEPRNSRQLFPQISLSGRYFEKIKLNFYIHQNASIRIFSQYGQQQFEFRQDTSNSVPSWRSNVTIIMPSVDWITLELKTNTDGDFILIDKLVASQCNYLEECKTKSSGPTSSTTVTTETLPDTSETSFTFTEEKESSQEFTSTTEDFVTTDEFEMSSMNTGTSPPSSSTQNIISTTRKSSEDENQNDNHQISYANRLSFHVVWSVLILVVGYYCSHYSELSG